jgi:hypothetical protein
MALYYLEYDLRNQRNYQKLYDELSRFNAIKILESLWCFNRADTSVTWIRDHFKNYIDSDDAISVAEVSNWATYKTISTPNSL